ncbi:hypothetical protein Tco_0976903 [Tanacetum coccineum]|uniref:Uncharacterized protein n=1 Tax=Tanacetum coccineum TaxID=301880 RepID=A0ABQ5EIL4_9ASTR
MTSDQIRSDLTPNRQETSVDNISSDLVSNKQKASDYDISGPEQEEKQDSTYSIRSTDKVALEEFDLKSALFKHMNKNKTANIILQIPLYHALWKLYSQMKMPWIRSVGLQKRRRPESAASGSAQPPLKDDSPKFKETRESDAYASNTTSSSYLNWMADPDTRDDVVNSLMHMLPNNIQITDTSLMHMLNLNPSPHKEDSLVLLSEIPLLCQRRGLLILLRSSRVFKLLLLLIKRLLKLSKSSQGKARKLSRDLPGTGGSNEGTGNILGVPDESTVISRASSEGTGSKPGVPDEEKLILEWEADVVSEHFDRDDNAGDDNEETKPDPEEIYNSSSVPLLILQSSISHLLNQYLLPVKNHSLHFHHQHPHYSKAVQFLKWSSHGSCVNQFRTCAFFDDSWIHQFRTSAKLSFSNTYVPPSKKTIEIMFVTIV